MDGPIPGEPAKLRDLVSRLHSGWQTLRELRNRVSQFDKDTDWYGEAARAFKGRAAELPSQIGFAEARFWGAYWHLRPYIKVLEDAQRIGRLAQADLDASLDALGSAEQHREEIRSLRNPDDVDVIVAEGEVDRLVGQAERARRRIREARDMVKRAGDTCAANLGETIDDPLKDGDGGLAGLRRWLRNPNWGLPLGLLPGPGAMLGAAMNAGSTEVGREGLEYTSDALAIAGMFTGPTPVGIAVNTAALAVDVALYGHGRKEGSDVANTALGFATLGISRYAKTISDPVARRFITGDATAGQVVQAIPGVTGIHERVRPHLPDGPMWPGGPSLPPAPPVIPVGRNDLPPPERG